MEQSINALPPTERARHYRDLALEALWLAERAREKELRASYFEIARSSHALALEMEISLGLVEYDEAVEPNGNPLSLLETQ